MMTACQGTFPSMVIGLLQGASVRKMATKVNHMLQDRLCLKS